MKAIDEIADLEKRVQQFNSLSLPGQPAFAHMGTMYLINDLWRKVAQFHAEKDANRRGWDDCFEVNQELRAKLLDLKNHAYVWADDATPFTGAEVLNLLNENDRLRLALVEREETLMGVRELVDHYLLAHQHTPER